MGSGWQCVFPLQTVHSWQPWWFWCKAVWQWHPSPDPMWCLTCRIVSHMACLCLWCHVGHGMPSSRPQVVSSHYKAVAPFDADAPSVLLVPCIRHPVEHAQPQGFGVKKGKGIKCGSVATTKVHFVTVADLWNTGARLLNCAYLGKKGNMTTSISLSGIPWKLQQSQHWKSVLALEYSRKSWFSSLFFLFVHHHLILFFGSIVPSTILSFERKITKVHNLMQIQVWGQVLSSLYLRTKK